MVDIQIDSCCGGYRPTAVGTIGGRPFFFRSMAGGWSFGVAKEGVDAIWWHSPDEDLVFNASGRSDYPFGEESIPHLLEGLEKYLLELGVPPEQRRHILDAAERQAGRLFANEGATPA